MNCNCRDNVFLSKNKMTQISRQNFRDLYKPSFKLQVKFSNHFLQINSSMKSPVYTSVTILLFLFFANVSYSQGFLKQDGKKIVNDNGNFLIKGMGLGGWMLQEPYMLQLSGAAKNQQDIRQKLKALIGAEKTDQFYDAWLTNFITKGDIDSMASWGFNTVRLPMHFNLFTLPVDEEPVAGKNTWINKGFAMTDTLLSWCKAAKIYLILDLHAAPNGQGADIAISDRDESKPSLWQSEAAQQKTIELWKKLAERYVNEPWIGGYDLINEPNWGFESADDKNGLKETKNEPLKKLLVALTTEIRKIDKNHLIIIEGNGWGNNYNGMFPLWDNNMAVSFHKYWNYNDPASIQHYLQIREEQNVPLWCGESGENSNAWFTDAITLFQTNNIGWTWWPLKKMGNNNPLQVKGNTQYDQLLNYLKKGTSKPSAEVAFSGLMQLASDSKIGKAVYHKDVIDAMFRQTHAYETIPYKNAIINSGAVLYAVDYDLGRSGFAYHDIDSANYWVSDTKHIDGNKGHQYRNDGVDIERCTDTKTNGYCVAFTEPGEWLQYTINVAAEGAYTIAVRSLAKEKDAAITLSVNHSFSTTIPLASEASLNKWTTIEVKNIHLKKGLNQLRIQFTGTGANLNYLQFFSSKK